MKVVGIDDLCEFLYAIIPSKLILSYLDTPQGLRAYSFIKSAIRMNIS